jgi:hypothetical protein
MPFSVENADFIADKLQPSCSRIRRIARSIRTPKKPRSAAWRTTDLPPAVVSSSTSTGRCSRLTVTLRWRPDHQPSLCFSNETAPIVSPRHTSECALAAQPVREAAPTPGCAAARPATAIWKADSLVDSQVASLDWDLEEPAHRRLDAFAHLHALLPGVPPATITDIRRLVGGSDAHHGPGAPLSRGGSRRRGLHPAVLRPIGQ